MTNKPTRSEHSGDNPRLFKAHSRITKRAPSQWTRTPAEAMLIGISDDKGRYRIPLVQQRGHWQPQKPSKKARHALRQANSVYDLPSIEQAIKWMHAVCGYPVKTTWSTAAKAGNFVGLPLLTEKNINKYYPETDETPKGHMNQQQKNARSTKTPFKVCNAAAALR